MDKNLYNTMQELVKQENVISADAKYLGAITIEKDSPTSGKIKIGKDIFAVTIVLPTGTTLIKYYDENKVCIAGRGVDGELFPTRTAQMEFKDDLGFLSEINEIDETQTYSLSEIDKMLDEVSKILGIDKSEVLSLSQIELDKAIKNKDSAGIDLSENKEHILENKNQSMQNKDVLENLNSKQEIDLSKKFDDRYSLADKLGLNQSDHLVIVYSDAIINNKHTTRFTPVIKHANGEIEEATNLIQVGGKDSDKTVYETDRTGEKVEEKDVKSSFMVKGSNEILTVRNGQMGTIEVGFGEMDKTSHRDAFTQRLETREMYPVTSKVREEFSERKGDRNVSDKIDEIEKHKKNGCNELSLDEADGNPYTGHFHSDEAVEIILADEEVGKKIEDCFTANEVKERFESMKEKNPDLDFDELIEVTKEELSTDADYMHEHNR